MALTLGDNFSYQGAKPLDARLKYDTLANMKAVADATMYDGCLAYCAATDKTYQWKSTNTVDSSTGRWREFSSGGGASDFADLTDVDLTSLAEGDMVRYNATAEKWENISKMGSGEMDDVITPPPSVGLLSDLLEYSLLEHVVGQWIDGKPLYQRTFNFTNVATANSEVVITLDTSIKPHIAFIVDGFFEYQVSGKTTQYGNLNMIIPGGPQIWTVITAYPNNVITNLKGLYLTQKHSGNDWLGKNAYVTIRYTKDEDYT